MSYHAFYKNLDELARKAFPSLSETPQVAWDHLMSPLEIHLPKTILALAAEAIRALYAVSRRPAFEAELETVAGASNVATPHRSVLMAYDFHTNEEGECFLVEINTNASGYLLAALLETAHARTRIEDSPRLADLRASFEEEYRLARGPDARQSPAVAITDDDLLQQKMLCEFLMYRDWFQSWGWRAEFCEASGFSLHTDETLRGPSGETIDLVYNRTTDFYFENPVHAPLRRAFERGRSVITPNPKEYWRLADKRRLVQMTAPGFLENAGASSEECDAIRRVLIPTYQIRDFESEDEIWSRRKSLFFKPQQSYGGKSVYRGESVSRRVFERLMQEKILIQNFVPAQRVPHDDPRSVLHNWKFDLRFFVYADRVQLAVARIYQGQVTNFSSPLGGFTLVRF